MGKIARGVDRALTGPAFLAEAVWAGICLFAGVLALVGEVPGLGAWERFGGGVLVTLVGASLTLELARRVRKARARTPATPQRLVHGEGDNRPGSKRDPARRRIAEKRAAEAAERARAARRRRNVIGGAVAAVVVVIALVVVFAVQSSRTSTSANAAVPGHTVAGGTTIEVTAADVGGAASATGSAPVVVNLYEDLQCPNCKNFEARSGSTLAALLAQGKVVLHYHPMAFLDSSANGNFSTRALNAAAAVLDAAGPGAFQKFHDLIYANQTPEEGPGMTNAQLVSYANQAGATGPAVAKAIDSGTYDDWTKKLTDQASKDGVTGTPTVIIGGTTLTDLSPTGITAAVTAAGAK